MAIETLTAALWMAMWVSLPAAQAARVLEAGPGGVPALDDSAVGLVAEEALRVDIAVESDAIGVVNAHWGGNCP